MKAAPLKINALVPSEREKECTHGFLRWSGKVPCTGYQYCDMCGATFPFDLEKERAEFAAHCASKAKL